ncbi:hypothetical protein [Mycoplasmopsis felifaucium]|uniref:Uncharacterized protein n=1 Tax=Mycoplasmopsis felifaucium TaxID=35768 RepID=A0ABZ2RRX2_9BACT
MKLETIGTTAQAVYEINKEDNRDHKYILIQLDESINDKSDAYKFMTKLGIKNPKVYTRYFLDKYMYVFHMMK